MTTEGITLERYRACVRSVYDTLVSAEDGMTVLAIRNLTGHSRGIVSLALTDNPLFYVDRWTRSRAGVPTQVWAAAAMKRYDDCPRPDDMKI